MAQRSYDLPLQADGSGRFLPWFIGLMVYLAALALASSQLLTSAIDHWDAGLRGSLTVQIAVPADGSPLPSASLDAVLTQLRQAPGIARAVPLDMGAERDMLRPWLGSALDDQVLPLPILIDVHTAPGQTPDTAALERRLDAVVPGTSVVTHDRWLGRLFRVARLIALSGDLVVALVGAGAVLTIIFSTRTGLLIHQGVIELLHLVGARDSYIARQFQMHAFRQALGGGIFGLVFALFTIAGIALAASIGTGGDEIALFDGLEIPVAGWGGLLVLPLAAGLVALITARITVLRILGRMP